jgi:DNA-directed RNA polymerase specialized sigma24 family protein
MPNDDGIEQRTGNPDQWDAEYRKPLLQIALNQVRPQVADDLVQAVFLTGLKNRDRIPPGANVLIWLASILRSKIMAYNRQRGKETNFTDLESLDD